jgi:integrase
MAYRHRPAADKGLYPLPGNAGFEVRWLVRGKMHCQRLRGVTKTEARNWRNEQIANAKAGRSPTIPGRLMFADLVRLKREAATTKQNRSSPEPSRFLADYFGFSETKKEDGTVVVMPGWKVVEITDEQVSAFKAARMSSGKVKLDTMQADLRWLRHAFNLAVKAKRLSRDQCPTIEVHDPHNVRSNFPEPDQLERIRAALPAYLRGVVLFAELTAWRIKSMVLPLRWEHIDLRAQMIRLPAELSKNKRPVVFPFGPLPDLKQLLEYQLAGAEPVSATHVFYNPKGRAIDYKVMRKAWKAACRKAKCPGTWLHDLCRVGARNLRRAGVSVDEVMKLGRWKTPSMFQRYNIIDEEDLKTSVAKLAAVRRAAHQQQ